MQKRARPSRMLSGGPAEMRSPLFSNAWRLTQHDEVLATVQRFPRLHISEVRLADGTRWSLEPERWGVVRALEDGVPFAHATRESWSGRRWEVGGVGFAYLLRPTSALRRRWALTMGNEPVVELKGGLLTYNRVRMEIIFPVPVVAVLLAWHVMARSWEAAAIPTPTVTRARPWPAG